jgi:hypothetical protein
MNCEFRFFLNRRLLRRLCEARHSFFSQLWSARRSRRVALNTAVLASIMLTGIATSKGQFPYFGARSARLRWRGVRDGFYWSSRARRSKS